MRRNTASSPKFSASSSSRCSAWTPAPACSWPPPPCPPGRRRCCWASWTPGGRLPGGSLCLCTPPSGCGSCSSDAPNKAWWGGEENRFPKASVHHLNSAFRVCFGVLCLTEAACVHTCLQDQNRLSSGYLLPALLCLDWALTLTLDASLQGKHGLDGAKGNIITNTKVTRRYIMSNTAVTKACVSFNITVKYSPNKYY